MTGTNDFGAVACIHRRDNSFTFIISTAHGIVFIKRPGSSTIFKERLDCEHAVGVCDRGQVPIDYLIERLGTVEHIAHISDPRCVPLCQRLIKSIGIVEHPLHCSDTRRIPVVDVLVEISIGKHVRHVRDTRSVPIAHTIKKDICPAKCVRHIGYVSCIPVAYRAHVVEISSDGDALERFVQRIDVV